ncbi:MULTISPECIES: DUF433 domain-containing protein [Micromonospora]|uniref:Uncharacterized conserved protein, DUF433 family n=1 Tax=Micromonospora yangpuensis TaxID=683228 RepID=A0A1C6TYG0_9ACTN|nr:DUF433 domain-containing protein [Micromonospora yangpuensis]GGM20066.1 hypothetical protein GCM10012279_43000 [Micromonospora yangpuensis]SCL46661.1 Uncharacterized conserved protein, DUF433 family [Micromonospora yangpuensis]
MAEFGGYCGSVTQAGVTADERFTVPLLTAHAAGVHLGIPPSTVKQWMRDGDGGQPAMHSVPSPSPHGPRLPFVALAEAQILRELRNTGLSMHHIRAGVARLKQETGEEYVLATNTIATDGEALLYNAATKVAPEWVRAHDGQMTFRQVVEAAIKYVSYAPDGFADRIILRPYGAAQVIIDPRFGFGQPVFSGNKVRVETIADLFYGGNESVEDIADEYDLSTDDVEAVLRVMARRAA